VIVPRSATSPPPPAHERPPLPGRGLGDSPGPSWCPAPRRPRGRRRCRCRLAVHFRAFTERLEKIGATPSIDILADSFDNVLADAIHGLHKAERSTHQSPKAQTTSSTSTKAWFPQCALRSGENARPVTFRPCTRRRKHQTTCSSWSLRSPPTPRPPTTPTSCPAPSAGPKTAGGSTLLSADLPSPRSSPDRAAT